LVLIVFKSNLEHVLQMSRWSPVYVPEIETGRHVKNNACAVEIKIKWMIRKHMTYKNTYRDDKHKHKNILLTNLGSIQFTSPRFLCRPTAFFPTCWSRVTSESSTYGKQRICRCNSASTHFHVSWLSDFIFYPKPLYKWHRLRIRRKRIRSLGCTNTTGGSCD
jgi:hypothetical protein